MSPQEIFEPVSDALDGMNFLTQTILAWWLWFVANTGCVAGILAVLALTFHAAANFLKLRREWIKRPKKTKPGRGK